MTKKRFYEINSQILGLKTIQDKNKRYTFPPIQTEKNHMFLKALNELSTDCSQLKKENDELKEKYKVYKQAFLETREDALALKSSNLEYEDALARFEEENKIVHSINKIQLRNLQDFKHQIHILIEMHGNDLLKAKYKELIE